MNILLHGVPDDEFLLFLKSKNKSNSLNIYVTEGRPLLKGGYAVAGKLISMELKVTVITDNMVACLVMESLFDCAFIFYHEINDIHLICQIGSAIVALCAKHFKIPIYYHRAAKIEDMKFGNPKDLLVFNGIQIAPTKARTFVPLLEKVPLSNLQGGFHTFASE
jgi:translation initiation factor 2B subunit (eIF-2B alpha/beta/delta family)